MDDQPFRIPRPKVSALASYVIPALILAFTLLYSLLAVDASIALGRKSLQSLLFLVLVVLMYATIYTGQVQTRRENSEAYKHALARYSTARADAIKRSYSVFDRWLYDHLAEAAEGERRRIISPYISWDEYTAKYRAADIRALRKLGLPKDVRLALIRAARVKPCRLRRSDLLSYDPAGRIGTIPTARQEVYSDIRTTLRTLTPKLLFAAFSVSIAFSVSRSGTPELLALVLQLTSLLTTAASASANAKNKIENDTVAYLNGKAELLSRFVRDCTANTTA